MRELRARCDGPVTVARDSTPMRTSAAAPVALAVALGLGLGTVSAQAVTPQATTPPDSPARAVATGPALDAGAGVFLPNLDDDAKRCGKTVDVCNDATDEIVNGPDDAKDLARIRLAAMPGLSASATGTVGVTTGAAQTRLFVQTGGGWQVVKPTTRLTAAQLKQGVTFGLEGKDIVRDPAVWDGTATVALTVTDAGTSTSARATLQSAPLLTTNHTMPTRQVVVDASDSSPANTTFLTELLAQAKPTGIPVFQGGAPFRWFMQDAFEQMYATMPTEHGAQSMSVLMLSETPEATTAKGLLGLRGPDLGFVWAGKGVGASYGNVETLPPTKGAPNGTLMIGTRPPQTKGSKELRGFINLMKAQGHTPLELDVDFLVVGHVDEIFQVLPANTARGWRLAVADPEAGLSVVRKAVQAGAGSRDVVRHPAGKILTPTAAAAVKAGGKGSLLPENREAARVIAKNLRTIQQATGLKDSEIVRIPVLYRALDKEDGGKSGSLVPSAINSLLITPDTVIAPKQFSLRVKGNDVFEQAVTNAYRSAGITVRWVDDFESHHVGSGEVHCATNTLRALPV